MSLRAAPTVDSSALAFHLARLLSVVGGAILNVWVSAPTVDGCARVTILRSHKDAPSASIAAAAGSAPPAPRRTMQTFFLLRDSKGGCRFTPGSAPFPLPNSVVHASISPSGDHFALLRHFDEGAAPPQAGARARVTLELYDVSSGALLRVLSSPDGLHSVPLADPGGAFSEGLAWSSCERFVAYVAETVAPHVGVASLYAAASGAAPPAQACAPQRAPSGRGAEWEAGGREDWGEKLTGVALPRIFVCDLDRSRISEVPVGDAGLAVGQPAFAPRASPDDPLQLVFCGYPTAPRRLGLLFCTNRPCALYAVDLSELEREPTLGVAGYGSAATPVCLTRRFSSARSARFSPNGRSLVFLASSTEHGHSSPHGDASNLFIADWRDLLESSRRRADSGESGPHFSTLLPYAITDADDEKVYGCGAATSADFCNDAWWPGLYTTSLPRACWSPDSASVFVNTQRAFELRVCRVTVEAAPTKSDGSPRASPRGVVGHMDWVCSQRSFAPRGGAGEAAHSTTFWGCLAGERGGSLEVLVSVTSPSCPEALRLAYLAPNSEYSWGAVAQPLPDVPTAVLSVHGVAALPRRRLAPSFFDANLGQARHGGLANAWDAQLAVQHDLSALRSVVFPVSAPSGGGMFQAMILWSTDAVRETATLPLVLVPHGGPHSAFSSSFYSHHAFLATIGFAVLSINYRGSTGYGAQSLFSLPGRVGSADVEDCIAALDEALKRGSAPAASGAESVGGESGDANSTAQSQFPHLDATRVAVMGGSHGGFIAAHLVSNPAHRARFSAAVLRNPVTNMASMISSTDIPDWCWAEGLGCPRRMEPALDAEKLVALFNASPIAHVRHLSAMERGGDGAKGTPILLLLGLKDRRVPPSQGLEWWHALRAGPAPPPDSHARLLIYPEDTHALDSAAAEADAWVQIAQWLATHLARVGASESAM